MVSFNIFIEKHDLHEEFENISQDESQDDSQDDSQDESEDSEMDRVFHIHNRKNDMLMIIHERDVDGVVFKVLQEFQERADFGYKKYGTDLDREDLSFIDWIQHAKEEHMDAILYLEKIRQKEIERIAFTKKNNAQNVYFVETIGALATLSAITSALLVYVMFLNYYY